MESCKEFVSRIVRSLIELRAVRRLLLGEFVRSLFEWRAVRSLLGEL